MLDGFDTTSFSHGGATRPVYRAGHGPGVIIMHEVPGITPEVAGFARTVADAGFTVVMPEMFGTAGRPFSMGYLLGTMTRVCIGREFHVLAAHRSSPITEWLRALCRDLHQELGGAGIGAVGMCLTGNFALSLMMEPSLMAPVLSQPSLPLPIGAARRRALHLSPEELANVKTRAAQGCGVLGLRFTGDAGCPPERFARLREELGENFEAIEVPSESARSKNPHSVLTRDLVDEAGHPTLAARARVIAFLKERLSP